MSRRKRRSSQEEQDQDSDILILGHKPLKDEQKEEA
jgi:hypothetical protein